jgi:hypothetical protein
MTDRLIKVLEQDKQVLRGLKPRGRAAVLSIDDNETLSLAIDWTEWLGTDTIDSVTNQATGVTVSGATNTTTAAALTVSALRSGWIEHRITTDAGLVKEKLILVEVGGFPVLDDYGVSWRAL